MATSKKKSAIKTANKKPSPKPGSKKAVPTKRDVKNTKKAVKKTTVKIPAKKVAKKANPKNTVAKKAAIKKSVKSASNKPAVKSSSKKGNAKTQQKLSSFEATHHPIIFDVWITDEGGIEGDKDVFWENMEEDFFFIVPNYFDKLPLTIIKSIKIKVYDDYYLRYVADSEFKTDQLLNQYLEMIQEFCKNPDRTYFGSLTMRIGDLAHLEGMEKLIQVPDLFDQGIVSNPQHVDEYETYSL